MNNTTIKDEISISDWVMTKRGEITIKPLIPEVENSSLLVKALRTLVEEDEGVLKVPKHMNLEEDAKRFDRMFHVVINAKALKLMSDHGFHQLKKADAYKKKASLALSNHEEIGISK
ncbi:MAG TPA: hypothetical protein EYH42_09575, partial [Sulfurovum sp.]|nr:hypothetical protein [Sulfurovum sp.]